MVRPGQVDPFSDGEAYERYIGRWSRHVARSFLDWLNAPRELIWVDVGCGTGALTGSILNQSNPGRVIGVEPSDGYLTLAASNVQDSRAEFRSGDAQSLPLDEDAADMAVSGLVLNFVPDKMRAAQEMRRVVKPGGTVALYVWDYAGEMQSMRYFWNAISDMFPDLSAKDEGKVFPICQPGPLADLFNSANLQAIEVQALEVPTAFVDFEDYWTPFLGGQGPAGACCLSLSEEDRSLLRQRLQDTVPAQSDGSIHLTARAWCVKGTVPA